MCTFSQKTDLQKIFFYSPPLTSAKRFNCEAFLLRCTFGRIFFSLSLSTFFFYIRETDTSSIEMGCPKPDPEMPPLFGWMGSNPSHPIFGWWWFVLRRTTIRFSLLPNWVTNVVNFFSHLAKSLIFKKVFYAPLVPMKSSDVDINTYDFTYVSVLPTVCFFSLSLLLLNSTDRETGRERVIQTSIHHLTQPNPTPPNPTQ